MQKGISAQRIVLSELNSVILALRTQSRFSSKARFVEFYNFHSTHYFISNMKYLEIWKIH